jgi:UTP--glucose-1-phosphate uridylyltransferase
MKKIVQKSILVVLCGYISSVSSTKVVVPMAGLGTRLLPLTKAVPKSMVALIDKPALHYVVDEAVRSDITDFFFIVNGEDRPTIEAYFSSNIILETILAQRNKIHLLEQLNNTLARAQFTYIRQPEPLGLGHAVLLAEEFVQSDKFFCVMLPDNIIESNEAHMAQLMTFAEQYRASVITVEEIPQQEIVHYAAVMPKQFLTDRLFEVGDIIEKPKPDQIKCCFAQVGRSVFSTDIFEALKNITPGVGGEIQLSDAVAYMVRNGKRVLACTLHGKRHDVGTTKGLLKTTVSLGLRHPQYKSMLYEIFERTLSE